MPRKKSLAGKKKSQAKTTPQTVKKDIGKKFSRLKGMKDILFEDQKYWDLAIKKSSELARLYGFRKIDTPVMENFEFYKNFYNQDSEVFNQIYSFTDPNNNKLALRPDSLPSMARAYVEHNMFNLTQPIKMHWCGPVFRYEKVQSGRLRQMHQFSLGIFGEDNSIADFMLILIAYVFFRELQIDTQVQINNLGCEECRDVYLEELKKYYRDKTRKNKLCSKCKNDINKNPLRLFNCPEESCQELKEEAPPIIDFLCDTCRENFMRVLEYLDEMEVPYNLNPCLFRCSEYYNGTVFEIWPVDENGEINSKDLSLAGGGRCDAIVEKLGVKDIKACGFSVGLERTVNKMRTKDIPFGEDAAGLIFMAQLGDQARRRMIALFEEFRRSGFNVGQAFTRDNLKDQLDEAKRLEARYSLILGQKEFNDNTILLRDMESGNQEIVDLKKIKQEVEKRLKNEE